jgi:hypothetical protein
VCSKIEDAGVEEDGDMVLVVVVKMLLLSDFGAQA